MQTILETQVAFSQKAFGPGPRTGGVSAHILKELLEVREAPSMAEWTDVAILGFDGLTRQIREEMGATDPDEIARIAVAVYEEKIIRNTGRPFPMPKDQNTPSEAADGQGKVRWKPAQAVFDVLEERRRQVEGEGWTPEHDDGHADGQIAGAAACYVLGSGAVKHWGAMQAVGTFWPWSQHWFKPGSVRRMLVKAAALIIAEIERLDRKAAKEEAAGK